jgi:hypothetical protein
MDGWNIISTLNQSQGAKHPAVWADGIRAYTARLAPPVIMSYS